MSYGISRPQWVKLQLGFIIEQSAKHNIAYSAAIAHSSIHIHHCPHEYLSSIFLKKGQSFDWTTLYKAYWLSLLVALWSAICCMQSCDEYDHRPGPHKPADCILLGRGSSVITHAYASVKCMEMQSASDCCRKNISFRNYENNCSNDYCQWSHYSE